MRDAIFDAFDNADEDALHCHFESFKSRTWIDVGKEGARIAEAEEYSPVWTLSHAIAAAAADGVLRAFAEILGVDKDTLESTVEDWLEMRRSDTIGACALMKLAQETDVREKSWL